MSDVIGSYPDSGPGGQPSRGEASAFAEPSGPARPASGSPLNALVERHFGVPGSDRRLGFIPTQIR